LIWIKERAGVCRQVADMAGLQTLFSLCAPGGHGAWLAGTNLAGMGLLGLAGSALHCGPMCGPLVLGQAASRMACLSCSRMTEPRRLLAGLMPRYHAGRMLTYAALGAGAGLAGGGMAAVLQPVRAVLLVAAALALLVFAWGGLLGKGSPLPGTSALSGAKRAFLRHAPPGGLVFGMVLGLLPCGLIYTALLAAAATCSPLWGAAGMAAFGLATVPVLAAVGVTGRARVFRRAAPYVLSVNAAMLLAAGLRQAVAY
jgi:sulfite exporter TauE/SafE